MHVKLYIFFSGYQKISKQKLFVLADKDEKVDIPVPYFLIEVGENKILIDTGISVESKSSPLSDVYSVSDDTNPIMALKKVGVDKDEINYIIQTHLHFDHAANTKLFPKAKVIVQLEEIRAAFFDDPSIKHGYVKDDIRVPTIKWEPIVGFKNLFDGKILVFPTPGHTPGHQSVLVRLKNYGPVILAGDVAPLKDNVEHNVAPGVASNPDQAFHSLESLKEFAEFEKAQIWYGHDPGFFKSIKVAPYFYD